MFLSSHPQEEISYVNLRCGEQSGAPAGETRTPFVTPEHTHLFIPFCKLPTLKKANKEGRASSLCVGSHTQTPFTHFGSHFVCLLYINIYTQKVKSKRAHGGRYPIWPLSFRLRAENNLIFHLITSNESNPRAAAPNRELPSTPTTQPTTLVFIYLWPAQRDWFLHVIREVIFRVSTAVAYCSLVMPTAVCGIVQIRTLFRPGPLGK